MYQNNVKYILDVITYNMNHNNDIQTCWYKFEAVSDANELVYNSKIYGIQYPYIVITWCRWCLIVAYFMRSAQKVV